MIPATEYLEASHYQELKNQHYNQPESLLETTKEPGTAKPLDTEPTTIPPETGTTITMDTTTSGPTTTTRTTTIH